VGPSSFDRKDPHDEMACEVWIRKSCQMNDTFTKLKEFIPSIRSTTLAEIG
jgi:hypothetical protein